MEMISSPRAARDLAGAAHLFIGEIDNIFPEHHAQFRGSHADFLHGRGGLFDIGRKFVGDGGDRKILFHGIRFTALPPRVWG